MEHGRRVWWHLGTYLMAHLLDASDMDSILDVDLKTNLSPVLNVAKYFLMMILFWDIINRSCITRQLGWRMLQITNLIRA